MPTKFPLSGKAIDTQSIDERQKLVRRSDVNATSELWHLVNFASFIFFQNENSALLISQLLNAMGVKIIASNVALTGLTTFPSYADYTPQNKERVLLIAQTDSTENGFYEWQSGGTLVRLYDWRDIVAGNGISISANNLAVRLLEYLPVVGGVRARNDNFLQFVGGKLFARIAADAVGIKLNANGELFIDEAELSSGGGGASLLDVANPDIDGVVNSSGGMAVYLPNTVGYVEVVGGNFRTAPISPVTLVCDGIVDVDYLLRKHNNIQANIEVNDLIGSHTVYAKHLTLQSNENDGSGNLEYNKITILGAATIDTVTPAAKRNDTTTITVTGEGFAVLSTWAANNAGITIVAFRFITRLQIQVDIAVTNAVASGLYNLTCTNFFSGLGTFTSGTSGNNKLQVFGDPQITTVFLNPEVNLVAAEVGLGETIDIIANGYDLGTDPDVSASIGDITVNSISGTITKKTINVTGSTSKALIGIKNLLITDTSLSVDSDTSGNNKVALNYKYDSTTKRKPATFRAYGGTTNLADWTITSDATSVTVTKTGGTGDCGLEITDLFLVASLLELNLGGFGGTYIECEVLTAAASIPSSNPLFVMVGQRSQDYASGFGGTRDYSLRVQDGGSSLYNFSNSAASDTSSNASFITELRRSNPTNSSTFTTRFGGTFGDAFLTYTNVLGTPPSKTYTAHENKGLYISMNGNYSIRFNIRGWIGD